MIQPSNRQGGLRERIAERVERVPHSWFLYRAEARINRLPVGMFTSLFTFVEVGKTPDGGIVRLNNPRSTNDREQDLLITFSGDEWHGGVTYLNARRTIYEPGDEGITEGYLTAGAQGLIEVDLTRKDVLQALWLAQRVATTGNAVPSAGSSL